MATLGILLVIVGCTAYQYLKGTLATAFATIINAIIASFVAFGFFEPLSGYLIQYAAALSDWAQVICFTLLLLIVFAVLQTVVAQLSRHKVDLGLLPERIGRIVCGVVLGYIASGLLLTAVAMAPLPSEYPYQRFDQRIPDAERPNRALLNADGFAAGLFSLASNGSFSAIVNKKSFAALHPAYLDQVFLNRHNIADKVPLLTASDAIEVPAKNGAWYAPESIRDSQGKPLSAKPGSSLVIVRIGIRRNAMSDAGIFTLSQLRLICRPKNAKYPLAGKGRNVYPVGYLAAANQLETRKLNEKIDIQGAGVTASAKWIDFAFYVPADLVPVLAEFKLNNVAEVPPPVSAEQAPPPEPFVQPSQPQKADTQPQEPSQPTKPPGSEPSKKRARGGRLSDVSRSFVGDPGDDSQ